LWLTKSLCDGLVALDSLFCLEDAFLLTCWRACCLPNDCLCVWGYSCPSLFEPKILQVGVWQILFSLFWEMLYCIHTSGSYLSGCCTMTLLSLCLRLCRNSFPGRSLTAAVGSAFPAKPFLRGHTSRTPGGLPAFLIPGSGANDWLRPKLTNMLVVSACNCTKASAFWAVCSWYDSDGFCGDTLAFDGEKYWCRVLLTSAFGICGVSPWLRDVFAPWTMNDCSFSSIVGDNQLAWKFKKGLQNIA